MLVLSRKKDESIIIDVPPSDQPQRIAVMIRDVVGRTARIAFDADKSVIIARSELVANWRKPGTTEDKQG